MGPELGLRLGGREGDGQPARLRIGGQAHSPERLTLPHASVRLSLRAEMQSVALAALRVAQEDHGLGLRAVVDAGQELERGPGRKAVQAEEHAVARHVERVIPDGRVLVRGPGQEHERVHLGAAVDPSRHTEVGVRVFVSHPRPVVAEEVEGWRGIRTLQPVAMETGDRRIVGPVPVPAVAVVDVLDRIHALPLALHGACRAGARAALADLPVRTCVAAGAAVLGVGLEIDADFAASILALVAGSLYASTARHRSEPSQRHHHCQRARELE